MKYVSYMVLINQIAALFLIMFFGYFLRKKEVIKEKQRDFLFDLLLDYILPFMVISAMIIDFEPGMLENVKYLLISWAGVYLFMIIFASVIARIIPGSDRHKRTIEFLMIFSNVVYMGLPVLGAIFPDYGVFYGSIGIIPFNVVLWTYGVYLLQDDGSKFEFNRLIKIFNNNGTLALAIGFIILLTGINLPAALVEAIDLIGDATFPISMLVIGASLYGMDLRKIVIKPQLIGLSFFKLIILPLATFFLLLLFPLDSTLVAVIAVQISMPVAANSVIFTARFPVDYKLATEGVFLTTFLALFTIPLIVVIVSGIL